jgi:dCMP deaminase
MKKIVGKLVESSFDLPSIDELRPVSPMPSNNEIIEPCVTKKEETKKESKIIQESKQDSRPDWDTWFMTLAYVSSQRSLDPDTKHGCIVVDSERTILSIGYNSPPRGCDDTKIPLNRPDKYKYMEHAESNAIINAARSGTSLKDSTFYITGMPCHECLRKIINVGAKRIIYGSVNSTCNDEECIKAQTIMLSDQDIEIINLKQCEKIEKLLQQTEQYVRIKAKKV